MKPKGSVNDPNLIISVVNALNPEVLITAQLFEGDGGRETERKGERERQRVS